MIPAENPLPSEAPVPSAAQPPGPGPPAPPTVPPPVPAPLLGPVPPRPRRTWIWPVIAVAVAAVVVFAVLFLTGGFGSGGGSSVPTGTPMSYTQALPVAIAEGQSASGGPWTVVAGEGVGVSTGISGPAPTAFTGSGCTFRAPPGAPASTTVPGTPGNATPGTVAAWVFFATNASMSVVLLILVTDLTASLLDLVSGCSDVSTFTEMGAVTTSNVVDSTAIASELDAAGGASFLANHTVVTHLFVLLGPSAALGGNAYWEAIYSTCQPTAVGGSGTEFSGTYYAASGSVFTSPTTTQIIC